MEPADPGTTSISDLPRETRALVDSLRQKYQARASGHAMDTNMDSLNASVREAVRQLETSSLHDPSSLAASATSCLARSEDLQVTICQACLGSGTRREEYNYRVMERACDTCDGRGSFLRKNGELITEARGKEGAQGEEAPRASPSDKSASSERVASLRGDIERISTRLASYTTERDGLRVAAESLPAGEKRDATIALVEQLDKRMAALLEEKAMREDKLRRRLEG